MKSACFKSRGILLWAIPMALSVQGCWTIYPPAAYNDHTLHFLDHSGRAWTASETVLEMDFAWASRACSDWGTFRSTGRLPDLSEMQAGIASGITNFLNPHGWYWTADGTRLNSLTHAVLPASSDQKAYVRCVGDPEELRRLREAGQPPMLRYEVRE